MLEEFDYEDDIEKDEVDEHEFSTSYKLNCSGIDFDVCGLVRRQNAKSIYLPDFQRNYVWGKKRASKFIESLLLGLPIPSVCLYREEDNKQIIIDGFQRLETIRLFYSKVFADGTPFKLSGVSKDYSGKTIEDLDEVCKIKLDDTLIHATVVKADDPQEKNYNAVYLIFERLNTGGVKLSPQEIRNCIYHGEFQKVIEQLSNDANFQKYFAIEPKRKKDQEIILRLFSLANNYSEYSGNMKEFLNSYMDSKKNENATSLNKEISTFKEALDKLTKLREEIFKPKGNLNLGILDAIFVGTFINLMNGKKIPEEKYASCINNIVNSETFKKYIETGKTHHTVQLKSRIDFAINEIDKINE